MNFVKMKNQHNLIFLFVLGISLILFSACSSMPAGKGEKQKAEKYSLKKDLNQKEQKSYDGYINLTVFLNQKEQKSYDDYINLTVFLNDGKNLMGTQVRVNNNNELDAILEALKNGLEEKELYRTIPDGNIVEKVEKEGRTVKIYLGEDYQAVPQVVSILTRSSLVKSYTSLESVDFVEFYCDNLPLKDSNNMPYGAYSFDDIVYDNELIKEIVYHDEIKVYYPRDGFLEGIVEEVDLSMNDNIEGVIIKMLKTQSDNNPTPAVPIGTKFINADIVDGICYLNLNEAFLHNNSGSVEDTLAVYSIVNTITELPDIAKVQFLINGEKMDIMRAGKDFDEPFEYSYELVRK